METLELNTNCFGKEGVRRLAEWLRCASRLRKFGFEALSGSEAVWTLMDAVAENGALRSLKLSWISFGIEALARIACNTSITSVYQCWHFGQYGALFGRAFGKKAVEDAVSGKLSAGG